VSTAEVAEAAKILENVYRAVNIALVNENEDRMTAMKSTFGKSSLPPAPKPLAFKPFIPARARRALHPHRSVFISPGKPAKWDCPPGSSNWPAK